MIEAAVVVEEEGRGRRHGVDATKGLQRVVPLADFELLYAGQVLAGNVDRQRLARGIFNIKLPGVVGVGFDQLSSFGRLPFSDSILNRTPREA